MKTAIVIILVYFAGCFTTWLAMLNQRVDVDVNKGVTNGDEYNSGNKSH